MSRKKNDKSKDVVQLTCTGCEETAVMHSGLKGRKHKHCKNGSITITLTTGFYWKGNKLKFTYKKKKVFDKELAGVWG